MTGAHLRVGREDVLDLLQQLVGGDVRLRCDRDLVELPGLAEESLRGGQIEAGQRRSADGRHRAEFHDSGYPEPLHRADGLHTDGLADAKVLLARSRLVDYDLVLLRP